MNSGIHSSPKVSVIITVYNGEKYIEETLQSIVEQAYPNLEIVVVNDGSTDNTANILKEFPAEINYHYQKKSGIATGWNRGVKEASGRFISFIDADDTWTKGKLNSQVEFLNENPDVDIAFGYAQEFSISDNLEIKRNNPIAGVGAGTMMIQKKRFLDIGFFNPEWRKGIFCDWYLRATEAGLKIHMDSTVMLNRRIHDSNHGVVQRDKYVDYVRMLKASLERKRNK